MTDVLRIANCSGFYGDRLSAAREMVEGGPIDVLTGDYLAELHPDDPPEGSYEGSAARLRAHLPPPARGGRRPRASARGIKIVVNAGGLNPAGCAEAARALYQKLGVNARRRAPRGRRHPAEARRARRRAASRSRTSIKGAPLARAAGSGALRQRLPRRLGHRRGARARRRPRDLPARHRRARSRSDRRPGGSAGSATTGISSRRASSPGTSSSAARRRPAGTTPSSRKCPTSCIPASRSPRCAPTAASSSPSIRARGGSVSVGTVTAQLLYEIGGPALSEPRRHRALRYDPASTQDGPDRVLVHGIKGEPPPPTHQGLHQLLRRLQEQHDVRARRPRHRGEGASSPRRRCGGSSAGASASPRRGRRSQRADRPDPGSNEEAFAYLTISVKDPDAQKVGRAFSEQGRRDGARELPGFLHDEPAGRRVADRRLLADARPVGGGRAAAGDRRRRRSPIPHVDPPASLREADSPGDRAARGADGGADARRAARHDLRRALGRQGRQRQRRRLGADARSLPLARRATSRSSALRELHERGPRRSRSTASSSRTFWR